MRYEERVEVLKWFLIGMAIVRLGLAIYRAVSAAAEPSRPGTLCTEYIERTWEEVK